MKKKAWSSERMKKFFPEEFNYASCFTYMMDLLEPTYPPRTVIKLNSHIGKAKEQLYHQAEGQILNEIKTSLSYGTAPIESALNLLEKAAENERKNEIAAIEAYKRQLDNITPENWKNNKEFEKVYNELLGYIINGISDQNIEDFYLRLTKAINLIRQEETTYLQRLEQLVDKEQTRYAKTYRDLTSNQYLFRAYGDIETMFKEMIGIASRKVETSISSKIQQYVYDYVNNKHRIIQNENVDTETLMALVAAVLVDFERVIQNEYYKETQKNGGYTANEDPFKELIDKSWKEYLELEKKDATLLQQAINGDKEEFKRITQAFKSLLGIRQLNTEEIIKRQEKIHKFLETDKKNYEKGKKVSGRNAIYKKLKNSKSEVAKNRLEELATLTWNVTTKTDTRHGTLNEMAAVLIGESFTTHGASVGEDIYTIATVEGKIDSKKLRAIVSKHGTNIVKRVKQYYYDTMSNSKRTRQKLYADYYKAMNEDINKEIELIKENLKKTNTPIEDIFIYHESLKLYSRIETGKVNEFEGRSLNILSAFDRLYSLADLEGVSLLQQDVITTIAANLSSLAAGNAAKGPLEQYLSIFAGLLMFDDIYTVVSDAIKTMSINNPKQIHLYLLNSIYVPSSMILTNIYKMIREAGNLAIEGIAKIMISTKGADATITEYVSKRNSGVPYDGAEWSRIGNDTINGTKIQITFLAGFMQLLEKLSNI